ncbi:hypothetical protein CL616_04455 [archaeon]|nr:hypothetical protein [archaeon]|tara:strand:- start:323 stop:643 length:321 start_codon:yes stop_codon:yes gene_type:complete
MKYLFLLLIFLVGCSSEVVFYDQEGSDYVGTWSGEETTLIFSSGSFESFGDCFNSGSVLTREGVMVMTILESDCSNLVGVVSYYYSVYDDELTLVNDDVMEIYHKI